jgi:4-hydroxy-3-methylbut-2-enyl diphosphate reductase
MGVRRAVDLASAEAEASAYGEEQPPVYTLGPLIHNPHVLNELKRRGVETLDEERLPADLRGASVIIRAHGLSPQTEAELRRRGAKVIDATCPRVKSSQLKAAAFAQAGYLLFLAGEEHHAEITGIRGYYEAGALRNPAPLGVINNAAEAEKAAVKLREESPNAQTALIGQTTISEEEYRGIGAVIARYFPDLEIAQTICAATKERQDSLREIADKVDAVIIAGGKASANTRRLLAIAEAAGKPCALAETPVDIPPDFFKFNAIGLASGTSTPDALIDDIERAIKVL